MTDCCCCLYLPFSFLLHRFLSLPTLLGRRREGEGYLPHLSSTVCIAVSVGVACTSPACSSHVYAWVRCVSWYSFSPSLSVLTLSSSSASLLCKSVLLSTCECARVCAN